MMTKKQKKQAMQNLETLIANFNLCPEIKRFFISGKTPIAVAVPHIGIATNVPLSEHEDLQKIVQEFEEKYDACVYLCISSSSFLTMLYVSKDESDWNYLAPHENDNCVWAAVYSWGYRTYEFGDVILGSYRGVLTRVG